MQEDMIDYGILAEALRIYERYGYQRITTPWLVSKEAIYATKPFDHRSFETFDGHLVASGEQGFIQMALDGLLAHDVKLMTITPCFRDDAIDEWHLRHFVKIELCWAYPKDSWQALVEMIENAGTVLRCLGAKTSVPMSTPPGIYDLVDERGIELGSYGIRKYKNFEWVFGTGLAEPRFSQAAKARFKERCGQI